MNGKIGNGKLEIGNRLRPLNQPAPVAVEADERGAPKAVLFKGTFRQVRAISDTWRIDDEWWREPISREYLAVVLDDGRMLTLYHDLLDGSWYAQKD